MWYGLIVIENCAFLTYVVAIHGVLVSFGEDFVLS